MIEDGTSSLDKALQVFFMLDEGGPEPKSVGEMARQTGLDKAQVSRYLQTFSRYGLVERLPGRQGYRLGWRVVAVSEHAFLSNVRRTVSAHIGPLCRRLQESVFFSVRDLNQAVTLTSAEPERRLYSRSWNERPFPLIGSAVGYVLLADGDDDELRGVWEAETGNHSWSRVLAGVQQARQVGYSIVRNEYSEGVSTAAFPVHVQQKGSAVLVGVLSVSAPSERFENVVDTILNELRDAAKNLSATISGEITAR